jgi:hypothetical protein
MGYILIQTIANAQTLAHPLLKPMQKPQTKVAKNWMPRPSFSPIPCCTTRVSPLIRVASSPEAEMSNQPMSWRRTDCVGFSWGGVLVDVIYMLSRKKARHSQVRLPHFNTQQNNQQSTKPNNHY